jgi:hypothetical protein
MNWLNKIPGTSRATSGLEWTLWCKLPLIAVLGTMLPLVGLGLMYLFANPLAGAAQERWLQIATYGICGVVIFHWTMVLTVGIGCIIVMVMKGPGYVADGYKLSHRDRPRETPQSDEEAASARAY